MFEKINNIINFIDERFMYMPQLDDSIDILNYLKDVKIFLEDVIENCPELKDKANILLKELGD